MPLTDDAAIKTLLETARTIALVGASDRPDRPSYRVMATLQNHGYRVIPVNPAYTEVLGEVCYPSLLDVPEPIDIVDCFRASPEIPAIARDAIAIKARVLWMQLGVINMDAARTARDAGLEVVIDRCVKIEHARLFGGLNFVGVNTKVISSRRPRHVAN